MSNQHFSARGDGRRPRRREQLSDEAAAFLRELIISGELPSGSFIRLERIAEALGSSVTPVREALVTLRGEGFVDQAPRRGFMVAPISGEDIRDLFLAQALLAGELAARAVDRCSPEQLASIRSVQTDLDAALDKGELDELERLNHDFHRLITRTADLPRTAWLLGISTRYVPRRFFATITGWPQASADDHVAIVDAFAAREPEVARAAMAQHFAHAGELLANHLDSRLSAATSQESAEANSAERPATPLVRRPPGGAPGVEDRIEWP